MIRQWHDASKDKPKPGQLVWMRRGYKGRVALGLLDPVQSVHPNWMEYANGFISSISQDVTHWVELEPAPSLLSSPDEAIIWCNRMATMLEKVQQVMPEPWESLDLQAMDDCIVRAKELRKR